MSERQCKKCENFFPATDEYFYPINGGRYLTHMCKRCVGVRDNTNQRNKRHLKRAGIPIVPKQTPASITQTPEYQAFKQKRKKVEARLYRARAEGNERSAARMAALLRQVKDEWYQRVAQG